MLSSLKEAADKNLNHLVYTLDDKYSSFFSKIIISEVLRRNNIFSSFSVCENISLMFYKHTTIDEVNLNGFYDNKVTLYWDKPYFEYLKSNRPFDAKYLTSELKERFSKIKTTRDCSNSSNNNSNIDVICRTSIIYKFKRGYHVFRLALFVDSSTIIHTYSTNESIDKPTNKKAYNNKGIKHDNDVICGKENTSILETISKVFSNNKVVAIVSFRIIVSFILFVLQLSSFTLAYYGLIIFTLIKEIVLISKDLLDSNGMVNKNFVINSLPSSIFFIVSIGVNSLSLKLTTLACSLAPMLSDVMLIHKQDKN